MKFLIRLFLFIFLIALVLSGCGDTQTPASPPSPVVTPTPTFLITEVEPNDDLDTAQSIPVDGTVINASIGAVGDKDVYQFTGEAGYGYCVRLSWVSGPSLDLYGRCFDSEDNVIFELDDNDETQAELGTINFHDVGGTYYFEVSDCSDTTTGEYQISVTKGGFSTIGEVEPNDDFDSAQEIPVDGTEVTSSIGSEDDYDYYEFTGEAGYSYCIRLTWVSGQNLDLYGRCYDSEGNIIYDELDYNGETQDEKGTIDFINTDGVYYLEISDYDGINTGEYKISVTKGAFGTASLATYKVKRK